MAAAPKPTRVGRGVATARRHPVAAAVAIGVAIVALLVLRPTGPSAGRPAAAEAAAAPATGRPPAAPPVIPIPGHEVYGYVPYWEMDDGIAEHVAATDLSTLALFSVTHGNRGALATGQNGYRRITGEVGRRLIAEATARGVVVELVYTSFGAKKNETFFTRPDVQDRTIGELVALATDLGVGGINVDVELLPAGRVAAYGAFVGRLREAFEAARPGGRISVATTANLRGAAMAAAASAAGADRIFMMGYDYRWAGSEPGASSPLDRRDGSEKDLPWSLDLYRRAGVPVERTILGLPLYGMSWPARGPEPGAAAAGEGSVWIPRRNLGLLADPAFRPTVDELEGVEYVALPDGDGWQAIYYDSPATLSRKLALANARGLAGAGFWAIGYERGLPDYTSLIASFRADELAVAGTEP